MAIYLLRKLAFFVGAVFVASVAIFLLIRAAGGNVAAIVLGKEPVRLATEGAGTDPDVVVGYVRSAAYGYTVGRCLTSVMLPVEVADPGTRLTIEWFGERLPATVVRDPVWDPAGERIRA